MAESISLFEKLVRTTVGDIAKDRAPTEEELKNACSLVRKMLPDVTDAEADAVVKKLQTALDVAMDTGIVISKEYEPWLKARKDEIDFYYWNRYVRYLEEDMHRPSSIIATIDDVSDRIVDLAGDPSARGNLKRRGLIIGDVQSGKTANYIAVMNKAADVGFKVIILLTGTVESLRRQTQERVDEGFIGRSSKEWLQRNAKLLRKGVGTKDATRFATGFTTESSDFKTSMLRSMNASLKNMAGEPVVFVLKKNAKTLQNLIDWLENYNLSNNKKVKLPLLLIDDEADNASINTRQDNDPTTINKHIRKLLNLFQEWSYIGVTATPFANIFILPEKTEEMENDDLFPSDYIYALDAPTNYIGSNEVFGDNAAYSNALETIDDADAFFPYGHKQDIYIPRLPDSLYSALRYFLLANVARDIKGDETTHRSMLINVSRFVKVQDQISKLVIEWLYEAVRDIKHFCMLDEENACKNKLLNDLRNDWYNSHYPFFNELSVTWEAVQKQWLLKAVSPIEVRTINQKSSTKMLDYAMYSENGLRVIAVGGLSLSRGLTLEGLMVSYFHRNSQMYDTLMQMGRWFGYRTGYEKIFRIWMPDDAIGWYAHITQASNELREDIARMNRLGAIPRDFGLKVRAHPTSLIITARNKMKHSDKVERWITLDGKFFETPRFRSDIDIIRANKMRADELVSALVQQCGMPQKSGNQPLFWSDVPSELVCRFLRTYGNHPLNMEADGSSLVTYIQKNDSFSKWDVLIPSSGESISHYVDGLPIRPFDRPLSRASGVLSSYGTKMRIGTMGLTKHGLNEQSQKRAEEAFRESKRSAYETKYGDKAEEMLNRMSIPDRAYLRVKRNPIIIIHYLKPKFDVNRPDDVPKGFDFENDLMVGYGIGFPAFADSEPRYAVYYINMVEQKQYMVDEVEEDQLDDIDGDD